MMQLFGMPVTFSAAEVLLIVFSALTCILIISIWTRQAKEGRHHYSLSFMFFWLLIGSLLTFLSQFLLEPTSFPTFSFDITLPLPPHLEKTRTLVYLIPPTDTPLSGLSTVLYVESLNNIPLNGTANNVFKPSLLQVQICTLFAHLDEILWLGAGLSLLQWTWYLYRSLRRKLGVVSPRLMEAVVESDPASRVHRVVGGVESDMAAGYSFTRSIRSLADIWAFMPTFIVVPVAIVGLVVKTCIRSAFCCLLSSHNDNTPISDQNRAVVEEQIQQKMKAKNVDDVFEAWPKWPKYLEDDPTANRAAEAASCQLSEIQVHSPTDVISSSPRPATMSSVSEHPTLATKLRVDHLDLNDTRVESYGYDITKQRIRYHKDTWSYKAKVFLAIHHQLINDIVVCIVIPLGVFMLLFLFPVQGRAYDVYPDRGGCHLSSNGARADWIRIVVLQTLIVLIAALSLLFSILAILQFKKQHGALLFKKRNLSPSPAVLRLYKSTEIVKNILLFCVGMNVVLFLGCIVHTHLRVAKYKQYTVTFEGARFLPLFRFADHDRDVFLIIFSFFFVGGIHLSVFWTSMKDWWSLICCCCGEIPARGEECDDDGQATAASFPYPKAVEVIKRAQRRASNATSQATRTASPAPPNQYLSHVRNDDAEETEIERLERLPGLRVGIVEPSMVISTGSERLMKKELNDGLEEEYIPAFEKYDDEAPSGRQTPQAKAESTQTAFKPNHINQPSEEPEQSTFSFSSSSSSSSTTWLSSVPINADGALTAIPSTSSATFSQPPALPPFLNPLITFPLAPPPALLPALKPKLSKSSLRVLTSSSNPEPAYTQGPLPTVPDQLYPAPSTRIKRQSRSMVAAHSPPVLVQALAPALVGVKATSALRDNQIVSLTAVGKSSGITNIGGAQPLSQQQTVGESSMAATTTTSAAVSTPFREFRHEFDYNYSGDEGGEDDICELETMGAISLESLEFDDPTADYDSIRQTVIFSPEDRAMLESFVHDALISSTSFSSSLSSPTLSNISLSRQRTSTAYTMHSRTTSTSSFSNNRRSTSRSTRRHPSVVPHPNSAPYGHGPNYIPRASTSGRTSRRSGDTCDACFHLVSGGMNAVDLYCDGDGEGNEQVRHSAGDFGTRFSHHRKKSTGTLSYIAHQPHPLTFPPQSYPRNHGTTKGKFPAMNGTSDTILENEPARPDSPIDPIDS